MTPSASLPFPARGRAASGTDADAEPPHGDLVTVTRVFDVLEAEMLRGCLQAQGIPATLGDAQTVQTDTLLTVALGGIRLMVPTPFADAARATVEAFERGELAIDELPPGEAADAPDGDDPPAPPWRLSRGAWAVLALLLLAIVVF